MVVFGARSLGLLPYVMAQPENGSVNLSWSGRNIYVGGVAMMFSSLMMQHAFAVETVARVQRSVATERMLKRLKQAVREAKKRS